MRSAVLSFLAALWTLWWTFGPPANVLWKLPSTIDGYAILGVIAGGTYDRKRTRRVKRHQKKVVSKAVRFCTLSSRRNSALVLQLITVMGVQVCTVRARHVGGAKPQHRCTHVSDVLPDDMRQARCLHAGAVTRKVAHASERLMRHVDEL